MARAGGERGNWLREGKPPSATHAIEKTPQFRASMERFAERAGERLSTAFGALFTAGMKATRNLNAFEGLTEHAGQPASLIYSEALDARMAILFEGVVVDLLINAMFGIEAPNDVAPPETLRGQAREVIRGAYKLEGRLLLILSVDAVLSITAPPGVGPST